VIKIVKKTVFFYFLSSQNEKIKSLVYKCIIEGQEDGSFKNIISVEMYGDRHTYARRGVICYYKSFETMPKDKIFSD